MPVHFGLRGLILGAVAAGDGHPSSLPVGDAAAAAAVGGEGDACWQPSSGEDSDGPQPVIFHSYYYPPNSVEFPGADSVSMVESGSAGTFLEIFWQKLQHSAQTFHFNLPSTDGQCTDTSYRPDPTVADVFFDVFAQSLLKLRSNFRVSSFAQFTF